MHCFGAHGNLLTKPFVFFKKLLVEIDIYIYICIYMYIYI